ARHATACAPIRCPSRSWANVPSRSVSADGGGCSRHPACGRVHSGLGTLQGCVFSLVPIHCDQLLDESIQENWLRRQEGLGLPRDLSPLELSVVGLLGSQNKEPPRFGEMESSEESAAGVLWPECPGLEIVEPAMYLLAERS